MLVFVEIQVNWEIELMNKRRVAVFSEEYKVEKVFLDLARYLYPLRSCFCIGVLIRKLLL